MEDGRSAEDRLETAKRKFEAYEMFREEEERLRRRAKVGNLPPLRPLVEGLRGCGRDVAEMQPRYSRDTAEI